MQNGASFMPVNCTKQFGVGYRVLELENNVFDYQYGWVNNTVEPNLDISGIGVISSFVGAAMITLVIIVLYYFVAMPSTPMRNGLDAFILDTIHGSTWGFLVVSERKKYTLRSIVLSFSDQQIVTGLAVLTGGFYQLHRGISAYDWQIVVYLAWFSSTTHLTTLTLLRDYMRTNIRIWTLRLALMMALASMLVFALLPTGCWLWKLTRPPGAEADMITAGVPAQCFIEAIFRGVKLRDYYFLRDASSPYNDSFSTMVTALTLIFVNYSTKVIVMFEKTSNFATKWLRTKPRNICKKTIRTLNRISTVETTGRLKKGAMIILRSMAIILSELLLVFYIFMHALVEVYGSLISQILWLSFTLIWGCYRLIYTRSNVHNVDVFSSSKRSPSGIVTGTIRYFYQNSTLPSISEQQNSWEFGQILPCLLLILPLLSSWQSLNEKQEEEKYSIHPGPPTVIDSATTIADNGSKVLYSASSQSLGTDEECANPTYLSARERRLGRISAISIDRIRSPVLVRDFPALHSTSALGDGTPEFQGPSATSFSDNRLHLHLRNKFPIYEIDFYQYPWFKEVELLILFSFAYLFIILMVLHSGALVLNAFIAFIWVLYIATAIVGFILTYIEVRVLWEDFKVPIRQSIKRLTGEESRTYKNESKLRASCKRWLRRGAVALIMCGLVFVAYILPFLVTTGVIAPSRNSYAIGPSKDPNIFHNSGWTTEWILQSIHEVTIEAYTSFPVLLFVLATACPLLPIVARVFVNIWQHVSKV